MQIKNGKKMGKERIGKKNKERVRAWFKTNPERTVADCARALRLGWQTVKKHVVAIQREGGAE